MSAAGEKILGSIREARAILRGESKGELVVYPARVRRRGAAGASSACRTLGPCKGLVRCHRDVRHRLRRLPHA